MKKLLLLLLLFTFCLGQLGRFDIPKTNITIHLNDLAIFTLVTSWLFARRQKAISHLKTDSLSKPILFVTVAMAVSLLANVFRYQLTEVATASLYLFRWVFYAGFYFFLKMEYKNEKQLLRRGLILAGLIISLTGLMQYLFLPSTVFLAATGWDDHYFRLIGVFFDPGFTGAILVILLAGAVLYQRQIKNSTPIVLVYAALALTYSRASYLMYLIIFAALAYFKKSLKIFFFAAIILGATILVLPKHPGEGTKLTRDNSVMARIKNWQQSVRIWTTAPIFGTGFGTYRYVQRDLGLISPKAALESHAGAGADSSILLMLATTGIIGFSTFIYLLLKIWQACRGDLLLKIILPALLVGSFFNNLLFYAWIMELVWVLIASGESRQKKPTD